MISVYQRTSQAIAHHNETFGHREHDIRHVDKGNWANNILAFKTKSPWKGNVSTEKQDLKCLVVEAITAM